jgi:hypothetical protein
MPPFLRRAKRCHTLIVSPPHWQGIAALNWYGDKEFKQVEGEVKVMWL